MNVTSYGLIMVVSALGLMILSNALSSFDLNLFINPFTVLDMNVVDKTALNDFTILVAE